jgi:hypothetical protein
MERYVPPNCRFTQDLLGATPQKTAFFIVTAVEISNFTFAFNLSFRNDFRYLLCAGESKQHMTVNRVHVTLRWHPTKTPFDTILFKNRFPVVLECSWSKMETKATSWLCLLFFMMMIMMMRMVCLPLALVICADSFQQNRPTGVLPNWIRLTKHCAAASLFFAPSPSAANQWSYYHHKSHNVIESHAPKIWRSLHDTKRQVHRYVPV